MKFKLSFRKKKPSNYRYFSIPKLSIKKSSVYFNTSEIRNDEDLLYLIASNIRTSRGVTVLPEDIILL